MKPANKLPALLTVLFMMVAAAISLQAQRVRAAAALAATVRKSDTCYSRLRPGSVLRVLVVGDSSAVGMGACAPDDTVAGRLGNGYPLLEIVNRAETGARTRRVIRQVARAEGQFLLALVQTGANDILAGTRLSDLQADLRTLLQTARDKARYVLLLTGGNLGLLPAFYAPLSWWFAYRTRLVRRLFAGLAESEGAFYVDMFYERHACPFTRFPGRFYASDRFHPNSEGYRLWYEHVHRTLDQTGLSALLAEDAEVTDVGRT